MLIYDDEAKCLTPMVWQDAPNEHILNMTQLYAGDFPLRTLKCGLDLRKKWLDSSGIESKIIFLVNDHRFPVYANAKQSALLKGKRAGDLRKAYYRQEDPFPKSFTTLMQAYGETPQTVALDNHNPKRLRGGTVPKYSHLFSETSLRNEFVDKLMPIIDQYEGFSKRRASGSTKTTVFYETVNQSICLSEEGEKCGCSGEIVQLVLNLFLRSINHIIMFIPDECANAVCVGSRAALALNESILGTREIASISVVSGLGGAADFESLDPVITRYSLEVR